MNKAELIEEMSIAADISKAAATRALNALTDSITDALKKDDQVTLVGFGTFLVRERSERKGRNPQTGAEITIKAAKMPVFKAGKGLKSALTQEDAETSEN